MLAHEMDVDIWEVMEAAATKPFGFQRFLPGIGPGGQCIPVNPYYISWKAREFDFHTSFIELAGDINLRMANYVMHRIHSFTTRLGISLAGANVLCLGAAFKAGVSDVRNSRAVKVMELLQHEGAHVELRRPARAHVAPRRRRAAPRWRSTTPTLAAATTSSWCWCATRPGPSTQVLSRRRPHVRRGERARRAAARHARAPVTRTAPADRPLRVLWLIKGLGPGGAERLLVEHAASGDRDRVQLRGRVPPRLEAAPRARARGARRAHALPRRAHRARPALGRTASIACCARTLRRGPRALAARRPRSRASWRARCRARVARPSCTPSTTGGRRTRRATRVAERGDLRA